MKLFNFALMKGGGVHMSVPTCLFNSFGNLAGTQGVVRNWRTMKEVQYILGEQRHDGIHQKDLTFRLPHAVAVGVVSKTKISSAAFTPLNAPAPHSVGSGAPRGSYRQARCFVQ